MELDTTSIDPELEFISGRIFDLNLPKEQQYLYRYFKTARQRMFAKYFLTYRSHARFVDHTGYSCSLKWRKHLRKRLLKLENAYKTARAEGDMATLALLESGQYPM